MVTLSVVQRSGQTLLAVADLLQYNAQGPLDSTMIAYTEGGKALKALTGTVGLTKIRSKNFVSREVAYEYARHRGFAALIDRVDQILDKNSAPRKALRQGLIWDTILWSDTTSKQDWKRRLQSLHLKSRGWMHTQRIPLVCWHCRLILLGPDNYNRHQEAKHRG
ncbi:hypothetical protein HBI28_214380 [Parastagonospora nodorum]|nr:hypothetical protein HBI28_214380 [Parastagonospora nodorum]